MIRSVVAALAVAFPGAAASAQPWGQNQPPDQWVMNCNLEKGRDCTVSVMADGGPNNLLGTFLIVSYSAAYNTLTIVTDGTGQSASIQVDWNPFVTTNMCSGGVCTFPQVPSADLLQQMLNGQRIVLQASLRSDSVAGPLQQSLSGFAAQYRRAVLAQKGR
jgi:invasion protein IalB